MVGLVGLVNAAQRWVVETVDLDQCREFIGTSMVQSWLGLSQSGLVGDLQKKVLICFNWISTYNNLHRLAPPGHPRNLSTKVSPHLSGRDDLEMLQELASVEDKHQGEEVDATGHSKSEHNNNTRMLQYALTIKISTLCCCWEMHGVKMVKYIEIEDYCVGLNPYGPEGNIENQNTVSLGLAKIGGCRHSVKGVRTIKSVIQFSSNLHCDHLLII